MELRIRAIFKKALLALLLLAAVGGWGAMAYLIVFTGPEGGTNELLFFILLFTAISSTTTLAAYRSSFRLFSLKRHQGNLGRALLQGIPLGLFVTIVAWLQALRMLTWEAGATVFAVVVILELLLLPRSASQNE
ncbi:MAG: hypothetical protein ABIH46_06400 [Chloroflexota bacterium]